MELKILLNNMEINQSENVYRINLDVGDKIVIFEYLKHFDVILNDTELVLVGPDGTKIIINNIQEPLQFNDTLYDVDINKNTELARLEESPNVDKFSYISFMDDEEADDNIIDSLGSLFGALGPAAAGGEEIVQNSGSFFGEFAERTGDETDVETGLRGRLPDQEDDDRFFIPEDPFNGNNGNGGEGTDTIIQDDIEDNVTLTPIDDEELDEDPIDPTPEVETPEKVEVDIKIYEKDTLVEVDVPYVTIIQESQVPTFVEVEFENTRTVEEEFTNYRTDYEMVEVESTKEVWVDTTYKTVTEEFTDTREVEETITNTKTELQDVQVENTRTVVDTEGMIDSGWELVGDEWQKTETTETTGIIEDKVIVNSGSKTEYDLEQNGDVSFDIKLTGKAACDATIYHTDGTYETVSLVNGTNSFNSVDKIEFDNAGTSAVHITDITGTIITTSLIVATEILTKEEVYFTTEQQEVEVEFEDTRIVTEEFTNTREVEVVDVAGHYETETFTEIIPQEIEVEFTDTREIVETFIDTRTDTVYETVTEEIDIIDPEFDLSGYIVEGDMYYEEQTQVVFEFEADDEVQLNIDELMSNSIDISIADHVIVSENIKLDLSDIIMDDTIPEEYEGLAKFLISDDNNDGQVSVPGQETIDSNSNTAFDAFNDASSVLTAEMDLINKITIEQDVYDI